MHLGEPANLRTKYWIWGIAGVLTLFFIVAFRKEIWDIFRLGWILFKAFFGFPLEGGGGTIAHSISVITFNCLIGFGFVFLVWLGLISHQAILPVRGFQGIYRTGWHLILYVTGRHGPALFIRDGSLVSNREEFKRRKRGVIVVDFNSAVVLEERDVPPGFSRMAYHLETNFLHLLSLSDPAVSPRVCGPGVVFTRPGERIRGIVDLRKQFRLQTQIRAYTREGIELASNVLAIFTIGQEPDVLQVTYVGARRPENLRILTFAPVKGGQGYYRLTGISENPDEMDQADRKEIDHFARVVEKTHGMIPFEPLPPVPLVPVFDSHRVFAAVFAQARSGSQEILPWTDLPTRVAAGLFRDIMTTINYDDLYNIREDDRFPLPGYKSKLRLQMRSNGILAFRLVSLKSGEPFALNKTYHESELEVSEVRQLTNSKVLRDRGIKIIHSSFGDPVPVSQAVYQQRLDSWRATWEGDLDSKLADRELEAMQVRSRAHAEAQQDLWYSLSQLLNQHEFTDEALAIRILQALENAAADPATRHLLPSTTMELMNYAHLLIMPQEDTIQQQNMMPAGFVPQIPNGGNGHEN